MADKAQSLSKTEIKWWWPVLIIMLSVGIAWGSLKVTVSANEARLSSCEARQTESTVDRIMIEQRLTRIETKLDSVLSIMGRLGQ